MIATLLLDPAGVQVTPTLSGTPIPNAEAELNLGGSNSVLMLFSANILAVNIRVEYSVDEGETWQSLANSDVLHVDNVNFSKWFTIPQAAKTEATKLRAVAVGLITCRVFFVELDIRG